MTSSITATPLTESAAVRVALNASAEQQVVINERYYSQLDAANAIPAAAWTASGNIQVAGGFGCLRIGARDNSGVDLDTFEAGVSSWSPGATGVTYFGIVPAAAIYGNYGLRIQRNVAGMMAQKTFTGLIPGTPYRVSAITDEGSSLGSGPIRFGVTGIGAGSTVTPSVTPTTVEYAFVATSTTHTLYLESTAGSTSIDIDNITVATNWPTTFDGSAYVTRTLSGLVIGRTYQVALPADSVNGTSFVLRVNTTSPTTKTISDSDTQAIGMSVSDLERSAVWMLFVATATTHELRVTPGATAAAATWYPRGLDVSWVGTNTKRLESFPVNTAEIANWSNAGTNPTNGNRTITQNQFVSGASAAASGLFAMYQANVSTIATYAPDSQFLQRTVTGLTAGRQYRILFSAAAYQMAGGAATRLRLRAGAVGKGESTPTTGQWLQYDFTATATSHVIYVKVADQMVGNSNLGTTYAYLTTYYVRVIDLYADLTNVYTLTSLTRRDVNGPAPVRRLADQTFSGGSLIVTDYEPALNGLVIYEAVFANSSTGIPERVNATTTLQGTQTQPRIGPATLPQFGVVAQMVTNNYTATRRSMGTQHEVVGRPDPLVTLGKLRMRQDTYELLLDSYAVAVTVMEAYQAGEVVFLREPLTPGVDMYHVASAVRLTPSGPRWLLSVDYVEVVRPTGPLLGALGWTFDAALTALGTFNSATAVYTSFNQYTVGPN